LFSARTDLREAFSAVACVDDAEPVACRISKYDEIWIGQVVPRHARGAEADQALDLVGMFSGVIDDEVEMCPWTFLGRGIGSMQRDARSSPDGGTRIVNSSSASANRTGLYPRTRDQNDAARSTSSAPSTTVPSRIMTSVSHP
jgi:hypothetical protein